MNGRHEIMFVAHINPGGTQVPYWARIGRVCLSKTGRTLYFEGRELVAYGLPIDFDEATGDQFVIRPARKDGLDRSEGAKPRHFKITIDEDAREEYWNEIREEPDRSQERFIRG